MGLLQLIVRLNPQDFCGVRVEDFLGAAHSLALLRID